MGIRFYCPNGHKLNVKAFQAGRRGICPYCGASVRIPLKSTRPSSKELRARRARGEDVGPGEGSPPQGGVAESPAQPVAADPAGAEVAPGPSPVPSEAAPLAPDPGPQASNGGSGQPFTSPEGEVTAFTAPPSASPSTPEWGAPRDQAAPPGAGEAVAEPEPVPEDPLATYPDVVWYVQPPSGGQFGPASADVMRTWLDEGRVGPDSLVWRNGWDDWQEAWRVFPELARPQGPWPSDPDPGPGNPGPSGSASAVFRPARTTRSKTSTIVITVLIVAVIVLLVVFLFILFKPPSSGTASVDRPLRTAVPATEPGPRQG